jgi:hypothetical protein
MEWTAISKNVSLLVVNCRVQTLYCSGAISQKTRGEGSSIAFINSPLIEQPAYITTRAMQLIHIFRATQSAQGAIRLHCVPGYCFCSLCATVTYCDARQIFSSIRHCPDPVSAMGSISQGESSARPNNRRRVAREDVPRTGFTGFPGRRPRAHYVAEIHDPVQMIRSGLSRTARARRGFV